jgi:adenylate kinase
MRVFVSNVDSPVGYSISRIFAQTIVGSRKEEEQPPAGDEEATGDENKSIKAIEEKAKVNYTVIGTLTPPRTDVPITDANGLERPAPPPPSHPGHYFETNDKAKNTARKEAISKFANPGQKPAWVSEIVNVLLIF